MRLIDSDELKNVLVKQFDAYFNENGKLMYSDHICTSDDVSDLFNLIDKQPTAYDVDKVVEELKKRKGTYFDGLLCEGTKITINEAIKIIRAGGKE